MGPALRPPKLVAVMVLAQTLALLERGVRWVTCGQDVGALVGLSRCGAAEDATAAFGTACSAIALMLAVAVLEAGDRGSMFLRLTASSAIPCLTAAAGVVVATRVAAGRPGTSPRHALALVRGRRASPAPWRGRPAAEQEALAQARDVSARLSLACACVAHGTAAVAGIAHQWHARPQAGTGHDGERLHMRLARYIHKAGHVSFAPASVLLLTSAFALAPLAEAGPRGLLMLARSMWTGAGAAFVWQVAAPPPIARPETAPMPYAPHSPAGPETGPRSAPRRGVTPPTADSPEAMAPVARERVARGSDAQ